MCNLDTAGPDLIRGHDVGTGRRDEAIELIEALEDQHPGVLEDAAHACGDVE